MPVKSKKCVQKLPISVEEAWNFFSSPLNLRAITPAEMGFNITSEDADAKMFPGMIISYTVRPILGIPLEWVTEITQVKEHEYFIDEQRFGPYSFWHHKHFFKAIDGGTEITDVVHYKIPLGPIGELAGILFVEKKINAVFDYRVKRLEELFGKM